MQRELLPREHVVDSGYVTPAHIERAARVRGIIPLGPVVANNSRQAEAGRLPGLPSPTGVHHLRHPAERRCPAAHPRTP
ncbi:hypothetical protein [Streptomyces sp. GbtcB6]|uniref:hypothetical protein n=1 Tax=Streptomyces sp. GbtcB6 TaxID=2824751 RepID=UPI001C2F4D08|nr:hypothetical protein [Streptomyces sp. GbtcB6]